MSVLSCQTSRHGMASIGGGETRSDWMRVCLRIKPSSIFKVSPRHHRVIRKKAGKYRPTAANPSRNTITAATPPAKEKIKFVNARSRGDSQHSFNDGWRKGKYQISGTFGIFCVTRAGPQWRPLVLANLNISNFVYKNWWSVMLNWVVTPKKLGVQEVVALIHLITESYYAPSKHTTGPFPSFELLV